MKSTIEELTVAAKRFSNLREEVEKLTSTINPIEVVTPLNIQQIKLEWIKQAKGGYLSNPVFRYNESLLNDIIHNEYDLRVFLEEVNNTNSSNSAESFYLDYLKDVTYDAVLTVKMAKAMLCQDDYGLAQIILEKYGRADSAIVQYADELAQTGFTKKTAVEPNNELQKLREAKLDATFIAELFTWTMEQYEKFSQNAKIWPVEVLDNCSAIDVRDKSSFGYPIVAIPKTREVNGIKLAELIGHEIECHWRNSQNARLLGLPKVDDETIYEGIAKLKDYRFNERYGTDVSEPAPYYILAQQYASSGASFAGTASYLMERYGLKPEKAWIYAYRTFRGSSDMGNSAHYAFTKDRAYLEGFLYVQQADANPQFRSFLSFGTLSKNQLEKLSTTLSQKEVEEKVLPDLNIQSRSIQQIINHI